MTIGDATHALGVSSDASVGEIRAAFRTKVKRSHPDRTGARADIGRLTQARDVLLFNAERNRAQPWAAPPLANHATASTPNPRRRADSQARRADPRRTTRAIVDRRVHGDRRRVARSTADRRWRVGRRPADDIRARRRELIAEHERRVAAEKQRALLDNALDVLAIARQQAFAHD